MLETRINKRIDDTMIDKSKFYQNIERCVHNSEEITRFYDVIISQKQEIDKLNKTINDIDYVVRDVIKRFIKDTDNV